MQANEHTVDFSSKCVQGNFKKTAGTWSGKRSRAHSKIDVFFGEKANCRMRHFPGMKTKITFPRKARQYVLMREAAEADFPPPPTMCFFAILRKNFF